MVPLIHETYKVFGSLLTNIKPLHELTPEQQAVIIKGAISKNALLIATHTDRDDWEWIAAGTIVNPLSIYRIRSGFINIHLQDKCPLCGSACIYEISENPCHHELYCSNCDYWLQGESIEKILKLHEDLCKLRGC